MEGSFPGSNSTSTTGPITWTILPWLICGSLELRFHRLTEGFGSAHDVQELLRDALLARLVELDGQHIDHLARVLGGRLHGRHAGTVLPRRRLHERAIHLDGHVARKERSENGLGARLVDVLLLRPLLAVFLVPRLRGPQGEELPMHGPLHGH